MKQQEFIQKGKSLVFFGCKIKPGDIKNCLLILTDLSNSLQSFSIRVIKNERPRKKLIIDVELAQGFSPEKYNAQYCLYELIGYLKKLNANFREYIRTVPLESFPELYFHCFSNICFPESVYRTKDKYNFN